MTKAARRRALQALLCAALLCIACTTTVPASADAGSGEQAPPTEVETGACALGTAPDADLAACKPGQADEAAVASEAAAAEVPPAGQERSAAEVQPPPAEPELEPPPAAPPAAPAAPPAAPADPQHNFALLKDGAKLLAANPGAKKPDALLDDDSDTFLKNECKAEKWVIVELSQVVKVSGVELAQFELYSSRVKEFEVWGRRSHPRTDGFGSDYGRGLNSTQWRLLGNLTAEKPKGSQVFALAEPLWVRFVQLRFLTHYGSEPVCALNGVSVFGRSAAEELEDTLAAEEEDYLDIATLQPTPEPPGPAVEPPSPVQQQQPEHPAAEPQPAAAGDAAGVAAVGAAGDAAAAAAEAANVTVVQPAGGEPGPSAAAPNGSRSAPANASGVLPADAGSQGGSFQAAGPALSSLPLHGNGSESSSSMDTPAEGAASSSAPAPALTPVPLPPQQPAASNASAARQENGTVQVPPAPLEAPAAGSPVGEAPQRPIQPPGQGPQQPAPPKNPPGEGQAAAGAAGGTPPPAAGTPPQAAAATAAQAAPGTADPLGDLSLIGLPAKAKASGHSVYDILVQEIKATKVQQKLLAKSVAELHRNTTQASADLAAELSRLSSDVAEAHRGASLSEEQLVTHVDVLVKAHLLQMAAELAAVQAALGASARQQQALMSLLVMLGSAFLLTSGRLGEGWPRAKRAAAIMAAANGLVGVVLQLKGTSVQRPLLPALAPFGT